MTTSLELLKTECVLILTPQGILLQSPVGQDEIARTCRVLYTATTANDIAIAANRAKEVLLHQYRSTREHTHYDQQDRLRVERAFDALARIRDLALTYHQEMLEADRNRVRAEKLKELFKEKSICNSDDIVDTPKRLVVMYDTGEGEYKVYDTLFTVYVFEAGETPMNCDFPKKCFKYIERKTNV